MNVAEGYFEAPLRAYLDAADPTGRTLALTERIERAQTLGLPTFWFKRSRQLPRTRAALSTLVGLWPSSVLDVGSGRGTSLWPMLELLPGMPVTAVERDPGVVRELARVVEGGLPALSVVNADAGCLPLASASFDVACALEVLEHLRDPLPAVRELRRVTRRALVATVPLGPDDNPDHHTVFEVDTLVALLRAAGFVHVKASSVDGHVLALAHVSKPVTDPRQLASGGKE